MPHDWQQHPSWGRGPTLDLCAGDRAWERLVVISAHPDDESLGVGGLIAHAHRAGIQVYLVLLTAGESSYPPAEQCSRHSLATRRLAEMDAAVELLAPGSPVVFLGAPDGGVADVEEEVVAALGEIVGEGRGTLLVAPWRHDGHPDHDAAGRAAARVAAACEATLVEYPLLMWHRLEPAAAPWDQMAVLPLDEASLEIKRAAIRAHSSQVRGVAGSPAAMDGHFLGHFTVPLEHLVLASDPAPDPRRPRAVEVAAQA